MDSKKTADQGHVDGQHNPSIMWLMYMNEEGVTQDRKEAPKWARKAAFQGEAVTQNNIGTMRRFGLSEFLKT